jgi:hypothetical protein
MNQGLQNASLDHAAMEKLAAQVVRDFATVCAKLKDMRSRSRRSNRGSAPILAATEITVRAQ